MANPRVGCVGYATSRGLGHLVRDFYLNSVITDVYVVHHRGVPTNHDWYPNAPSSPIRSLDRKAMRDFCTDMDIMLFFETPFDWGLIEFCKSIMVKTALVTMYECTPKHIPYLPDLFICPSLLDTRYFPKNQVFLTLPTDRPWKLRTEARHYIHNGGYLGLRGREGTTLLIEAMRYVKSDLKLTIRVQENVSDRHIAMAKNDPRIEYIPYTVPFNELYATGDVAVMPQKFNGCSLPVQEAFASGLLLMTTDRFPMNSWLPTEPLIPVARFEQVSIGGGYLDFDEAQIDPMDIARTMDDWYGRDISRFSELGREWGEKNSWKVLKSKWVETLENL